MEGDGTPIVGQGKIRIRTRPVHRSVPRVAAGGGNRRYRTNEPPILEETDVETIMCRRCKEDAPRLERPPFRNDRGTRIFNEICRNCWSDWLEHQTLLINHFGLDPRESESREFLYEQIDSVLFGEGDAEDIDTSRQGEIEW